MVDLKTSYLGLTLKNPLVASPSPLSRNVETVQELERNGIAAIVLYSLFEEQIIHDSLKIHEDLMRGAESYAEATSYIPDYGQYSVGPETYLDHLKKIKGAVSIPVIGSLNGVSTGGWIEYAQEIEKAGADALELNLYYLATDPDLSSAEVEADQITLVRDICDRVSIPVAVKLSPFYTALPNFAKHLVEAGAKGLVLFNRFYQPDFDIEQLVVTPNLVLSDSHELRLPLRWIAILYGRLQADFALTTGIHTGEDTIKALMAGASVAMTTSALLKRGPSQVREILTTLESWLEEREYVSIEQMKGSMSQRAVADPASFERANYIRVLSSY